MSAKLKAARPVTVPDEEGFILKCLYDILATYKRKKASPCTCFMCAQNEDSNGNNRYLTYEEFWNNSKNWFNKQIEDHTPGVLVTDAGQNDVNGWYRRGDPKKRPGWMHQYVPRGHWYEKNVETELQYGYNGFFIFATRDAWNILSPNTMTPYRCPHPTPIGCYR